MSIAYSGGLDSVVTTYESVRGIVASRRRRSAEGLGLDVTVPPNATGVVHEPAASAAGVTEIGSGRSVPAERAPGVRLLRTGAGRV